MNLFQALSHLRNAINSFKAFCCDWDSFIFNLCLRINVKCPDKNFIKRQYKLRTGRKLNLRHPSRFNEFIQCNKLYNRNPELAKFADKVRVKDIVAEVIGESHIVKTLGVWDAFDEIDFASLPERFVLKTNHDCGSVVVCRSKAVFDYDKAKEVLNRALSNDYYLAGREWPYHIIPRHIMAEELLEDTFDYGDAAKGFHSISFNRDIPSEPLPASSAQSLRKVIDAFKSIIRIFPFSQPVFLFNSNGALRCILTINTPAYDSINLTQIAKAHFTEKGFTTTDPLIVNGTSLNRIICATESVYIELRHRPGYEELRDYKVFCLRGKASMVKIDINRSAHHVANYYDLNGNLLPIMGKSFPNDPDFKVTIPDQWHRIVEYAEKLAAIVPNNICRNDFYFVNDSIYFGEITLSPGAGNADFYPDEVNYRLGQLLSDN